MIDIKTMDFNFIEIQKVQTYMNGTPLMEVQVDAGTGLHDMQADVALLKATIVSMQAERMDELNLIKNNPAVKDAYEKFKIVQALANVEKDANNSY